MLCGGIIAPATLTGENYMASAPPVSVTVKDDGTGVAVVDNRQLVINTGHMNQIRNDRMMGCAYVQIQGQNRDMNGTSFEEISDLGALGFGNWPSIAKGVILKSDNAQDDISGTGAKTVIVKGLDIDHREKLAIIEMNGTGDTEITTQEFLRIHEIKVLTAGTSLCNVGKITASINGVDIIALNPMRGKSQSGRYTVPTGNNLYLDNPEATSIKGKNVTFSIYTRNNEENNAPFVLLKTWSLNNENYSSRSKLKPIPEKTDVILLAKCEDGTGGGIITASVDGWCEGLN
jgi:hypothetical protein